MKKVFSLLLAVAVILAGLPSAIGAQASQNLSGEKWVSENEDAITKEFTKLGIDKNTQEKLIDKLKNGVPLDSMKPENVQELMDKSSSISVNDSITYTYPDGSKAILGNELIEDEGYQIQLAAGTYRVRSYWFSGIVNIEFKTEFVVRSGAYDYIVSSFSEQASIIGGTLDSEALSIGRKTETATRRAYSRYKITYTLAQGWGGSTFSLYFHVGNNTYETRRDLKDVK